MKTHTGFIDVLGARVHGRLCVFERDTQSNNGNVRIMAQRNNNNNNLISLIKISYNSTGYEYIYLCIYICMYVCTIVMSTSLWLHKLDGNITYILFIVMLRI